MLAIDMCSNFAATLAPASTLARPTPPLFFYSPCSHVNTFTLCSIGAAARGTPVLAFLARKGLGRRGCNQVQSHPPTLHLNYPTFLDREGSQTLEPAPPKSGDVAVGSSPQQRASFWPVRRINTCLCHCKRNFC